MGNYNDGMLLQLTLKHVGLVVFSYYQEDIGSYVDYDVVLNQGAPVMANYADIGKPTGFGLVICTTIR